MSWFNQVKFFYTSTIILLITFVWTVIMNVIFNINISFGLFVLLLVMSNLGRYILRRGINPKLCLVMSIFPICVVEIFITRDIFFAILNTIFSSFVIIKLFREENSDISYEEYKRQLSKGIYCIFGVGIIYSFMTWAGLKADDSKIYIGILVYIILVVIALREAMGYEYQIKRTKVSKYINYGLALFGILLTQETVYNKLAFLVEFISTVVGKFIGWLAGIIFNILQYPLMWLYMLLEKLFSGAKGKMPESLGNLENQKQEELIEQAGVAGDMIVNAIMVIIIILLFFILYKVVSKIYYRYSRNKSEEYTEFTEKIEVEKSKEKKLSTMLKKIFRKKGSPREEVLYKYGELVTSAFKKEFFKEYMTPSQLKKVIKVKVDKATSIDEITNIYNKAKFSKHAIGIEEKEVVEENVNNINKLMK